MVFSRLMSVRRVALPMLVILLMLGGALAWAIEATTPESSIIVTEASNQRAAARDDQLLLGRLVLPTDARSSPREPPGGGSTLASDGPHTGGYVIDRHAWWVVPGQELAVLAFVNAHLPAGSHLESSGWGSTREIRTSSFLLLTWPAIKSVLYRRALTVQFVALPNGSTGVRADAEDVWEMPRPASARIPSSARVLNVSVVPS